MVEPFGPGNFFGKIFYYRLTFLVRCNSDFLVTTYVGFSKHPFL